MLLVATQSAKIAELSLSLSTRCLSFDFIGTNPDESAEDVGTIQVGRQAPWPDRQHTETRPQAASRGEEGWQPGRRLVETFLLVGPDDHGRSSGSLIPQTLMMDLILPHPVCGWGGACMQVPNTWRAVIQEPATMQLYLDFYKSTQPPSSSEALQVRPSCIASPPLPQSSTPPTTRPTDALPLPAHHPCVVSRSSCCRRCAALSSPRTRRGHSSCSSSSPPSET